MKKKQPLNVNYCEREYEEPTVEIVMLSKDDVVSTSGPGGDGNQGEWDPQGYSVYPNY